MSQLSNWSKLWSIDNKNNNEADKIENETNNPKHASDNKDDGEINRWMMKLIDQWYYYYKDSKVDRYAMYN